MRPRSRCDDVLRRLLEGIGLCYRSHIPDRGAPDPPYRRRRLDERRNNAGNVVRVVSGVVAMGMAGRLLILPALVMGMAVVGDFLGEGRVSLGLDREKN